MAQSQMSTDLQELKTKEFLEKKRRQRLREENQELREIENQLRKAYFIKSLKDQQDQLKKKKQEELRQKEQESLEVEAQRKRHEELLKEREIQEMKKKNAQRETLRSQIVESAQRRKGTAVELIRERDHWDRLLQHMKLEQENEKAEMEKRKEAMKQDLENFMRQQELRKQRERDLDEQDRLRALDVQRQRDAEKKRIEELKRQERLQQAVISEKIGLDIQRIELEKRRREQVMLQLLEDERKAKEEYNFRANLERQVRARERVRYELETYIKKHKLEKELEKRNKLSTERAEMDRMILESEKKTALEIQHLREKEQAYNKEIQQMLEERRQNRATNVVAHLQSYELSRNEERKKQEEVEEERIRLLQEHPSDVLRHLPPGVLRESDREFLALPPEK